MTSANQSRFNHQIRAREVRVIADDGEQLGIMLTRDALAIAQEKGLDLVEVSPTAEPPVCRLMDFGKFKYEQQKKQQEAKKRTTTVQIKEIKVRPKTDEHDYQTKVKHVRRFIEEGDRVKMTVFFRGREIVHKDRGAKILARAVIDLQDIAKVEQESRFEGRTMFMLLAPRKAKGQAEKPAPAERPERKPAPAPEQASAQTPAQESAQTTEQKPAEPSA